MPLAACHVHATRLVQLITSVIAGLVSVFAEMIPLPGKVVTIVKTFTLDLIL